MFDTWVGPRYFLAWRDERAEKPPMTVDPYAYK